MNNSSTKVYTYIFIIIILLQTYLPSFKVNVALQIVVLCLYCIFERVSISRHFLKQITPFFYLILLGFIGTIIHTYKSTDIIKDISFLIKPVMGLLIGYLFYKKINNFKLFVKTIVVSGLLSAVIHLLIIKFFVDSSSGSIHELREFTRDNFLELYALIILIYYKRETKEPLFKSKFFMWAGGVLLVISNILYFSRTMIVLGIILALTFHGYSIITKKTIRIIVGIVISIALLYTYLYSINIQRNGKGMEAFLYKVKIAPEEIFKSQVSIENKSALWDRWRAYEAKRAMYLMEDNPSSYVFGTGIGSLVNLKFNAPLTEDSKGIRYISKLHNGYVFVIYKLGFIGLFIYLFIVTKWYMVIYRGRTFINVLISATGIVYFITSLIITGLYNGRDMIVFILGGLLFFYEKQQRNVITEKTQIE